MVALVDKHKRTPKEAEFDEWMARATECPDCRGSGMDRSRGRFNWTWRARCDGAGRVDMPEAREELHP